MKTLTVLLSLALLGSSSSIFAQSACEQVRLAPPYGETLPESFGGAVATNGRWAFIAQNDLDVSGGQNLLGLGDGGSIAETGAVFVYYWKRAAGAWTLHQTITPPTPSEHFGSDIDATSRHLIVGTQGKSYAFVLTYSDDGVLAGGKPGLPYWEFVTELSTGDGGQLEVLAADGHQDQLPNPFIERAFISLDGSVDVWESGLGGTSGIGSVPNSWSLAQSVEPFTFGFQGGDVVPDGFGEGAGSSDAFRDLLVVGASRTDVGEFDDVGTIYLFRLNAAGVYAPVQAFVSPTDANNVRFGRWVSVGLVDGETTIFAAGADGEVHMYGRPVETGNFIYRGVLPAPVGATGFGQGLQSNGNDLIVSATSMPGLEVFAGVALHYIDGEFKQQHVASDTGEFHGATMTDIWDNVLVRGRSSNFVGAGEKSAYIVRLADFDTTNKGGGVAGSGGFTPVLAITDCPAVNHDFTFEVSNGLGGAAGAIAISFGDPEGVMSSNGGLFFPRGPLIVFSMHMLDGVGAGNGSTEINLGLMPDMATATTVLAGLSDTKFIGQCLYLDSSVPAGYTQTNAVQLTMRSIFDFPSQPQ